MVKVKLGKRVMSGKVGPSASGPQFFMVHIELERGVWASWEFAADTVRQARINGTILSV